MGKSLENIAHEYASQVMKKRHEILDNFYKAYASQLSIEKNKIIDLQSICLIEQVGVIIDGKMCTKYWFEYKPIIED